MLAFLKRNLAFIEMFADGLRPLWGWDTFDCWLAEQRALVARADGKCRRGCGRPADHLEDFDCNDWPEAA